MPATCLDSIDLDNLAQSNIDPVDLDDANIWIDMINSEATSSSTNIWMSDQSPAGDDWVSFPPQRRLGLKSKTNIYDLGSQSKKKMRQKLLFNQFSIFYSLSLPYCHALKSLFLYPILLSPFIQSPSSLFSFPILLSGI